MSFFGCPVICFFLARFISFAVIGDLVLCFCLLYCCLLFCFCCILFHFFMTHTRL